MKLYTVQMSKHKLAKGQLIDATVKTGVVYFAPSWELVLKYKSGNLSEEGYTTAYYEMMRESFRRYQLPWLKLFDFEEITIGCYCPSGSFCHRYLLVDMLEKISNKYNRPFEYCGEIE